MITTSAHRKLPSLNALRAFEAAARHESFTRAAQELNVSAGAIAQQVKLLEEWIGSPLFQRSAQGVKLTREARKVLPLLEKGFDQLSESVSQLRRIGAPKEITIATLPSIALLWLSPRLPMLTALFPGYSISVSTMEYPPNFQRDDYDMAFFYLKGPVENATIISLGHDQLFPVCSAAFAHDHPIKTAADLQPLQLLHDAAWRHHWQLWLDYTHFTAIDASKGPVFSIYSLAMQAAGNSAGVLMGRSSLIGSALGTGQLVPTIDVRMPAPDELCLMLPQESPMLAMKSQILACVNIKT